MSVTQKDIVEALRLLSYVSDENGNASSARLVRQRLALRIEREGIAPPDGYAIVQIEPTAKMMEAVLPKSLDECKAKFNNAPVRMAMKDLQRVPLCCEVHPTPIDVKIMNSSYLLDLSHQIHYCVVNGGTQHEWLDELNNEILRRMQGHE